METLFFNPNNHLYNLHTTNKLSTDLQGSQTNYYEWIALLLTNGIVAKKIISIEIIEKLGIKGFQISYEGGKIDPLIGLDQMFRDFNIYHLENYESSEDLYEIVTEKSQKVVFLKIGNLYRFVCLSITNDYCHWHNRYNQNTIDYIIFHLRSLIKFETPDSFLD